jgi:hypothetical protein
MTYKEMENILNQFDDWEIQIKSDDGRRDSQDAEEIICKKINERLNINKTKIYNREPKDLYLLGEGEDLKIVDPDNFTNTISFTKLAKMLNLNGNSNDSIFKSYKDKKINGEIKLIEDYPIVFLNKKSKKFTICLLTELPKECITVNPSNCIQTKIPSSIVNRDNGQKNKLVHNLFIEYINKRILNPAKKWETLINGQ